jgi:hypothetical protein
MAANHKAELKNVESVLAYYKLNNDFPLWSVYVGISTNVVPVFEYMDSEQPEHGEEILKNFLELLKSDVSNTNVYTIQLIDDISEKKEGKEKRNAGRSIRFQLNQPDYSGLKSLNYSMIL